MIKIAISIGTLQTGGAEMFVINLLKNLNYQKYQVLLLVLDKPHGGYLEYEAAQLPIKIRYLEKKRGFRPLVMIKIFRVLKKYQPNILHGNIGGTIYFLLYLLFTKKIKLIHTTHTSPQKEFSKLKRRILKVLYQRKRIIPVVINNDMLDEFIKTYHIQEQVKLIPNGIDIKKFCFNRNYQFENIMIGHVGRFEEVKNHRMIVKVYKRLIADGYPVSLKLIGDGSLYQEVKTELQDYPVKYIKSSNHIEIELQEIDIFFFPSLYEGLPLSILEAMASGIVIIGSKTGGLKELIEKGKNGYLIDCNDEEGFYNSFITLLNDTNKIMIMSKNNINKVKQYSIEKMVAGYEKLYLKEAKSVKW